MATVAERNAAFDAVKAEIMPHIPEMFQAEITDAMILGLADAALAAAERVRGKD